MSNTLMTEDNLKASVNTSNAMQSLKYTARNIYGLTDEYVRGFGKLTAKQTWQDAIEAHVKQQDSQTQAQAELDVYISEQAEAVATEKLTSDTYKFYNSCYDIRTIYLELRGNIVWAITSDEDGSNRHENYYSEIGELSDVTLAEAWNNTLDYFNKTYTVKQARIITIVSEPEVDNSEQAEAVAPELNNGLTNDALVLLRIAATTYFNGVSNLANFDSVFSRYFNRQITEAEWSSLQSIVREHSTRVNGELKVDGCAASEPMKALFNTMPITTVSEPEADNSEPATKDTNVVNIVSGSSPRNRRTQQQLANRTVRRRANRFFRELAMAA